MKKIAIALFLFLMGCEAPRLPSFTVNDYSGAQKIKLNVDEIDVDVQTIEYGHLPHIEHKMRTSPQGAIENWVNNRFVANHGTGAVAIFVIQDASMVQSKKVADWYAPDHIEYKLTFAVSVVLKQNSKDVYSYTVSGHESREIWKKSALLTKEKTWRDMMDRMIEKINDSIIDRIPKRFVTQ